MTKQIGDWLQLADKRYNIWPPLELPELVAEHVRSQKQGYSSFCLRGYIANWAVDGGKLWLLGIVGEQLLAEAIPAMWISGEIDLLRDSEPQTMRKFESRYTKIHRISIDAGVLLCEEKYVWDSRDQVKRDWPLE